ncbi:excisionase family DNA binding protein [Thermosipho japonicus]|uniref:Excisionase family DNA binding protein n=1 Tax=Thermosipho japonicus TaxID=90323 RepID=A0A841GM29_9BACT|nr:helix-turn-helix domain-containing protein [Thermosipho japonicus]MBB6063065.1 excisionase family DNA binding protein [Thermosipho japonicus]
MFTKEQTKELSNLIFEQLIRAIDNYICLTEQTIDVNEASKVLGIKPDSVLKMIKRGKLIAAKKGKKWWIAKKYIKLLISKYKA